MVKMNIYAKIYENYLCIRSVLVCSVRSTLFAKY